VEKGEETGQALFGHTGSVLIQNGHFVAKLYDNSTIYPRWKYDLPLFLNVSVDVSRSVFTL